VLKHLAGARDMRLRQLVLGFGRWCLPQIAGLLGWKSGSFRF
jgi:hypothetical protein